MTPVETVNVRAYVNRRPHKIHVIGDAKQRKLLKSAIKKLESVGGDKILKYICTIMAGEDVSQVMWPYKQRTCQTINIGPEDMTHDEVEVVLSILHEALHAQDIFAQGMSATTLKNEIRAHERTKNFILDWMKKEDRPSVLGRLANELMEEDEYLRILRETR